MGFTRASIRASATAPTAVSATAIAFAIAIAFATAIAFAAAIAFATTIAFARQRQRRRTTVFATAFANADESSIVG